MQTMVMSPSPYSMHVHALVPNPLHVCHNLRLQIFTLEISCNNIFVRFMHVPYIRYCIVLLVNNVYVRNFRRLGGTKIFNGENLQITVQ